MSPVHLLLAVLQGEPTIVAVRTEARGARQALQVVTSGEPTGVAVRREGAEVIVTVGARARAPLVPGPVVAPIEGIRIERQPTATTLRVQVAPGIPYEVQRERGLVTVLFGGASPAPAPTPSPDLLELYKAVFPPPLTGNPGEPVGQVVTGLGEEVPTVGSEQERDRTSLHLGSLTIRPSVSATYVRARLSLETAEAVEDEYYQIQPRVGAELPLGGGRLTADYEARIRRESSYQIVEATTHLVNVGLSLPVASRAQLSASYHHARGVLETTEVDPGREYFFRLGRFIRNQAAVGARFDVSERLVLDLSGQVNRIQVEEDAGFFDHEIQDGAAALRFELSPRLAVAAVYSYGRVPPPPERPEAESRVQSAGISLDGEILPLVTGRIDVGYTDRRSPRAAEGGTSYRGVTFAGALTKEFTRSSSLRLVGSRSTTLSAFENNAFYVATSGQAELTLGLPFSFAFRGGAGYHWNQYRTIASGLGTPRDDRIFGWSVGLGRPITRFGHLRADYRRERRRSNLPGIDTESQALTIEVGLGLFSNPTR